MTPHQILEYIVANKGKCPTSTIACKHCPFNSDYHSCIDTMFPNRNTLPEEHEIDEAYLAKATELLMTMHIEDALDNMASSDF